MSAVRGVTCLQDIQDRCRVDEITGCWNWALAVSNIRGSAVPMVHIAVGAMLGSEPQGRKRTWPAARAAWLLAGKPLKPGQVVWRSHCGNDKCVNPEHCAAGTRVQMGAARAASGREKGTPAKRAAAAAAAKRNALPRQLVAQAEALLAEGRLQKVVAQELGINKCTLRRIARGTHPNSTGHVHLVRGASVFSLGAAV